MNRDRVCEFDGCTRHVYARQWCYPHYARWRRWGDPAGKRLPIEQRFWQKVDKNGPDGCWSWTAAVTHDGYAQFRYDGKMGVAHRFAYKLLVGQVPEGLELDHTCRNRGCVNPAHLEPVTHKVNMERGDWGPRKSNCPTGHALEGENLYLTSKGYRVCRECQRVAGRRYRERQMS